MQIVRCSSKATFNKITVSKAIGQATRLRTQIGRTMPDNRAMCSPIVRRIGRTTSARIGHRLHGQQTLMIGRTRSHLTRRTTGLPMPNAPIRRRQVHSPTGQRTTNRLVAMIGHHLHPQQTLTTGRTRRRTRSHLTRSPTGLLMPNAPVRRRQVRSPTGRRTTNRLAATIGHRQLGQRIRHRTAIRNSSSSINRSCRTCGSNRIRSANA
jgi:hypothetical protein